MQESDAEGLPIEDGESFVFEVRQLWALEEISQLAFEETSLEPDNETP